MGEDLVPLTHVTAAVVERTGDNRSDDTKRFQRESLAESTRRSYAGHIQQWEDYCASIGCVPYPADPVRVANYLAERATSGKRSGLRHGTGIGQSLGTIKIAYIAIRKAHKLRGIPFEDTDDVIRTTILGIRRSTGIDESQVKALRGKLIVDIITSLDRTNPTSCRDAALLSLGYMFARRRSELVALDWKRRGSGDGYVEIDASQAVAVIERHKTEGKEGRLRIVAPREQNRAAFAAIERWVAMAGIEPGTPILRRVRREGRIGTTGLANGSVPAIMKSCIFDHLRGLGVPEDLAREEAARYSGHSLRHGFATTAAEAGADLNSIAKVTKHRGIKELRRYVEQADALRVTAHNLPGVGLASEDES